MEPTRTIPNLLRACEVLTCLGDAPGGLTLQELCQRLAIPRTTAFRILNTFCVKGLVEKRDAQYVPGAMLLRLGARALGGMRIRELALPILRRLAEQTGETAHLAVLAEDKSLILEVFESPKPVRVASRPGFLADLHASATGKIFLAFGEPARAAALLTRPLPPRHTPRTHANVESLQQDLAAIRKRGYALDNEEHDDGVRCLAGPVYDAHGQLVAAMGITGAALRFTRQRDAEIARLVLAAARDLSLAMGGQGKQYAA